MRIYSFTTLLILFVCILVYKTNSMGYDNKLTHNYINKIAVRDVADIDEVLTNVLGMRNGIDTLIENRPVWRWICKGGIQEDEPNSRCLRHFHDPLQEWDEAGLFSLYNSMVYWAQKPDPGNAPGLYNDFSWPSAKEYFYQALTTGSEERYAKTFRSLGQLMHLISDAALPAHVRNDPHNVVDPYERWVEFNQYKIQSLAYEWFSVDETIFDKAVSDTAAPSPISALWDHDEYKPDGSNMPDGSEGAIGLAEYTNANFWTEDTFNSNPHPNLEDTNYDDEIWYNLQPVVAEDLETDNRLYFKKQNGDPIEHFMAAGYWFNFLYEENKWEVIHSTILDELCFEDYAEKLIPRAIGYSAALLDYFFRGSIEITLPTEQYHSGVYAVTTDPDQGFTRIALDAQNTTPNGERMTNGSVELIVKYKVALDNPFQSNPVPKTVQFSYITAVEANGVSQIPGDDSITLEFNLNPALPLDATDVTINLVYRGVLGNELDAIAVGYKDISEPTVLDIFSNLDKVCLDGYWYDAGSADAISLVDENANGMSDVNETDVYPHDLDDYYIRLSSVNDPQLPLRIPEDIHISDIHAGEYMRVAFFLGDDELAVGIYNPWSPCTDPHDGHSGSSADWSVDSLNSFRRQIYWLTPDECAARGLDPVCSINRYPSFTQFRGVEMHGIRITYEEELWGHDDTCTLDNLK